MKTLFPPKRILVAVDLSKPSLTALEAAKQAARPFGARLELVYVEPPAGEPVGLPSSLDSAAVSTLRRRLRSQRGRWRQTLARLTADCPAGCVRMRWVRGWPAEALPRLAGLRTADLIVTGTHGYTGADRVLFGSIAETIARHARVPVLSVHEDARLDLKAPMLVPHGLRPYADDSMLYGLELSQATGAPITALYVARRDEWEIDASAALGRRLESVFGARAARRVRVLVRRGDPRQEMLREAEEGRYGLVLLSQHLRPFSLDWLLGSTAERLLRRCPVPVLAVPVGAPVILS